MRFYGVDGCRGGWVYVSKSDERFSVGVVASLIQLIDKAPGGSRVFIDIPIGLHDDSPNPRACDAEARRLLHPTRSSSVFPAPVRAILGETDYESAMRTSRSLVGKGISKQTFAIMPKIREIDSLLANSNKARRLVREVHPEICFWSLSNHRAMVNRKKEPAGYRERIRVLRKFMVDVEQRVEHALNEFS